MSLVQVKQPTADKVPHRSVTRKALRDNPNAQEVADHFGIDVATVYRHAKGMDLKLIRSFKDLEIPVKDMVWLICHEMKQSNADAARILGVTQAYVSEVLNAN